MLKFHASILYLSKCVLGISDIRLFPKHLGNTSSGCRRHYYHDKNHGHHHKAHENIHAVGKKRHKLTRGKCGIYNYKMGTVPAYKKNTSINNRLKDRHHYHHAHLGFYKSIVYLLCGFMKFRIFMFLSYISLYHPDTGDIFLHTLI